LEAKTVLEKILRLLAQGNYSTMEIAEEPDVPEGNVRSSLSIMKRLCLVKRVKGKRGVPYTITDAGKEHLARFGWDTR
jgi:predicted transcriptional regulator